MTTWKETHQKGTFSRPLGENEIFIKLVGDAGRPLNRDHWAINATAAIEPTGLIASTDNSLEALLRKSWAHLRFQHPSLAAEVAPDDDKTIIYTVPADGAALNSWVAQTFSVATNAASVADVIPTFRPTPYAKMVWIPRSGELLCHTAHWRTDGIGVLQILDALLTLVASPEPHVDPASLPWGSEVARLAPSVEDAADMPKESTPELKERGASYVATFGHVIGATGIPYDGDAAALPAGTRTALLTINPETTSKVVAACKARDVSVTAAIHASVAGANYTLADAEGKNKHYTSTVRFGLRPYLPEPFSTPTYAAGLYTTGWMKRVEPQSTWAERLQDFHDAYHAGTIDRKFLDAHREYAAQLGEVIRNTPPGGDSPSDVDISSVGIAEKFIKRSYGTPGAGVEVKAVSVGVEMLTRQAVTFVWTFRDQLNLSVAYNEAFHAPEQMTRFATTELMVRGNTKSDNTMTFLTEAIAGGNMNTVFYVLTTMKTLLVLANAACCLALTAGGDVVDGSSSFLLDNRCADFGDQLSLPNTTVWFTETVRAGTNLTFPENDPSCNRPVQMIERDICRVAMLVHTWTANSPPSNLSMEAWLPTGWAEGGRRFLAVGNGGLNGCIYYEDMSYGVSQGFAAVGANNGHNGTSGAPLYKNPGAVEDYVYRSVQLTAVLGKQVTAAFYGEEPAKAYFLGCSTGGRQAFTAAQRFPEDFDGIVSVAPSFRITDRFSWAGSIAQKLGLPGDPGFVSAEQWDAIEEDMLRQCDHLDGARDGIIEDPNLCQYRPEALLCGKDASSSHCLTPLQAEIIRSIYTTSIHGLNGTLLYPRLQPGPRPRYTSNMTVLSSQSSVRDWFRYVVLENPEWDPADLTMEDWARSTEMNPYDILTWQGDLSRAKDMGTKILHYHGLEDELVSSDQSDRYYEHVSRTMNLRHDELDEFYRYFRVSGFAHCRGGRGAWKIGSKEASFVTDDPDANVLWAAVRWVEEGIGPEIIRGTGGEGNDTVTKNHCKYPQRAAYNGSGDPRVAESWTCA